MITKTVSSSESTAEKKTVRKLKLSVEEISLISNDKMITDESIDIAQQSVQQQRNSVDCGLFAIAFATSLAFGGNPCDVAYDQKLMRKHFLDCLKKEEMMPFPECSNSKTRTIECPRKYLAIELFCEGREPYDPTLKIAECME